MINITRYEIIDAIHNSFYDHTKTLEMLELLDSFKVFNNFPEREFLIGRDKKYPIGWYRALYNARYTHADAFAILEMLYNLDALDARKL